MSIHLGHRRFFGSCICCRGGPPVASSINRRTVLSGMASDRRICSDHRSCVAGSRSEPALLKTILDRRSSSFRCGQRSSYWKQMSFLEYDSGWGLGVGAVDRASTGSSRFLTSDASPIWRRRHSRNMRRTPKRTARSREPCPALIFICEPSFCKFQRVDRCPYIFGWHASPMVTTE